MAASTVESAVERVALAASSVKTFLPEEKIPTIVTDSFPALGKLTALRFLEWVQSNPGGLVSLPTGKTPEYFIKYVTKYLSGWDSPSIQEELREGGIDPAVKPDMFSLYFVQIDEFYPLPSAQGNSFSTYVANYYLNGFGMDPAKAMLIKCDEVGLQGHQTLKSVWADGKVDLSLRHRQVSSAVDKERQGVLERIDQWCQDFEEKIRSLGGIGFFLGGIGPDGHIAFNCSGSDHCSITRLTELNYPTQAAAAGSLGGIEVARNALAITIGLGTITFNPNVVAIIMAAGEAKAHIVAAAVEGSRAIAVPASVLQKVPSARMYLTTGAAKTLVARRTLLLSYRKEPFTQVDAENVLVDLCVKVKKSLLELTVDDVRSDPFAAIVMGALGLEQLRQTAEAVRNSLIAKIEAGAKTLKNTTFLHTEPHHDDIMLGYMAGVVRQTREATNTHVFTCLTSGFNSVTNQFMIDALEAVAVFTGTVVFERLCGESPAYFEPTNDAAVSRDVWQFLDGVAAKSKEMMDEGVSRRLIRSLATIYKVSIDATSLTALTTELIAYLKTQYPGQADVSTMQTLKGMCREFEAEVLWGMLGWQPSSVHHMRLGFYSSDIFNEDPKIARDVVPVVSLIQATNPDIIGVTIDPEASGPDTHYKVLQAISAALKTYEAGGGRKDVKVWGYRNVWFRFHPSESTMFVPVSINTLAILETAFMESFQTQKTASFPSYELDGPFCDLARSVQVEQYTNIKTCIGREWFHLHPSPMIRATRGLVYIKEMDLDEFYSQSRALSDLSRRI